MNSYYADGKLDNQAYNHDGQTVQAIWDRNQPESYLAAGIWAMDVIYRNHWSAQYAR